MTNINIKKILNIIIISGMIFTCLPGTAGYDTISTQQAGAPATTGKIRHFVIQNWLKPYKKTLASIKKAVRRRSCRNIQIIDKAGDITDYLDCFHTNTSGQESFYTEFDDPLDSQPLEDPPRYADTVFQENTDEEYIQTVLQTTHERLLVLNDAGCFSLVEKDVGDSLSLFPAVQGGVWHSALLYQIQRRLYIAQKRYEDALTSTINEFQHLNIDFIAQNDPQAFTEMAEILDSLGRGEEALGFLSKHITVKSRPYLRRQAALWKGKYYETHQQWKAAENAYLDALICAEQDPKAYLAFTRYLLIQSEHIHAEDTLEAALALNGIMHSVILKSPLWEQYDREELLNCIRNETHPALLGYSETGSEDDLCKALYYWGKKNQLEDAAPYWVGILEKFTRVWTKYSYFSSGEAGSQGKQKLLTLLEDIPHDARLSGDQNLLTLKGYTGIENSGLAKKKPTIALTSHMKPPAA